MRSKKDEQNGETVTFMTFAWNDSYGEKERYVLISVQLREYFSLSCNSSGRGWNFEHRQIISLFRSKWKLPNVSLS